MASAPKIYKPAATTRLSHYEKNLHLAYRGAQDQIELSVGLRAVLCAAGVHLRLAGRDAQPTPSDTSDLPMTIKCALGRVRESCSYQLIRHSFITQQVVASDESPLHPHPTFCTGLVVT